MQPDLDQNFPIIPLSGTLSAKHEKLPIGAILQGPQLHGQHAIQRRQRPSSTMWRLFLMIGDGLLLLISLALLLLLAPFFLPGLHIAWNESRTWNLKLIWSCIALVSWSVAVALTKTQNLNFASSRFQSPLSALLTLVVMAICWLICIYPFITDRIMYVANIILLFLAIAAPMFSLWRIGFAELMNVPRFRRQAVIVGANIAGETIARELKNSRRPTIHILGYIINVEPGEQAERDGLPILGGKGTLHRLMQNNIIDMVIMAIDYRANVTIFQEAIEAAQLGIDVLPMTMAYERISGKIPVEHVGDQWYVALPSELVIPPLYLCWRKVMDITFGLCGTLLLLLLLPIITLLISLDSRGPIFYRQERLGYKGRRFVIYKFRSMYTNAEQGGAAWTAKGDARVTRMGHFMRATHLDELPQVFNILHGDMSLIGPRPEREAFVAQLEQTIPFYRYRLMVKPGLSGWAQVKYHYASSNHDALMKLQYDLYYVKHQSFILDIFIILKTVVEVLSLRGR